VGGESGGGEREGESSDTGREKQSVEI
jgi:hypothetical protein